MLNTHLCYHEPPRPAPSIGKAFSMHTVTRRRRLRESNVSALKASLCFFFNRDAPVPGLIMASTSEHHLHIDNAKVVIQPEVFNFSICLYLYRFSSLLLQYNSPGFSYFLAKAGIHSLINEWSSHPILLLHSPIVCSTPWPLISPQSHFIISCQILKEPS